MFMRSNTLLTALTLLVAFIASACSERPPEQFKERLVEGQAVNRSNEAVKREDDVKEIHGLLRGMFEAVEKKDLSSLNGMIDARKGVWVDLKAEKTAAEFAADLADPAGYVNTYYLNTEALRRHTGENDQKALHDLIEESTRIRADLFFQADECEVRLTIEKPERLEAQSYRFNNAYFIKEGGRWYLYRLF